MNKKHKSFFGQYRNECVICNNGKSVAIPANDPKNGQCGDKIDILFINERPGPKACESGYITFENRDESAKRFKKLFIQTFGLNYRNRIFITNAVIWCPLTEPFRNYPPTHSEVKDGSKLLRDQIKKINPKVIVAMGRHALRALHYCFKDNINLKLAQKIKMDEMAGKVIAKNPHKIIPLFHTSSQCLRNRPESTQINDWQNMAKNIK